MKIALRILGVILILVGLCLIGGWLATERKPGKLTWDNPVVRDSIMTFGYNVYANPQVENGRYYLSKLVLKNEGGKPVRDLKISYQIPNFVPWTTPEVIPHLPGGTSVVKLYYPRLPDSVSRLANKQTATLEMKLTWNEEGRGPKEETLRSSFVMRGLNEMQYSDLPNDEMVTWYDQWTLTPFLACMVTPNDPVVKEYAAAISERMGGTMASVRNNPEDVYQLMQAIYEYMYETGMRYTGAKGVPENIGDIQTLVQTIRLPRDVITSNNGLCIELAILWSSILDHLGVNSYILMRPGHAFTIAEIAGTEFPVECTAITPKAVGQEQYVPFENAMRMAAEDLQNQQFKFPLSVQELHSNGFTPPELPDIDLEKIKKILADRKPAPRAEVVNNGGGGQQQQQGEVLNQYSHSAGLLSFNYPAHWSSMTPSTQMGITFTVVDQASGAAANVYEVPNATDVENAMSLLFQAFRNAGTQVDITESTIANGMTIMSGTSQAQTGNYTWMGVFKRVQGGVIGVTMGAPSQNFQAMQASLTSYLSTVRIP